MLIALTPFPSVGLALMVFSEMRSQARFERSQLGYTQDLEQFYCDIWEERKKGRVEMLYYSTEQTYPTSSAVVLQDLYLFNKIIIGRGFGNIAVCPIFIRFINRFLIRACGENNYRNRAMF